MRIVIGFDGSDESRDAVAVAHELSREFGAELIVACVYEQNSGFFAGDPAAGDRVQVLARLFEDAARELSYCAFDQYTSTGSPAECLAEAAYEFDADLIVIGSTHRGAVGRVVPGGVSTRLLNGTGCAVAVAPRGFARRVKRDPTVIGAAFDGGSEALLAVEAAAGLARRLGCALRIIGVVPHLDWRTIAGVDVEKVPSVREELETRISELADGMRSGIEVSTKILEGDPATRLGDESEELYMLFAGSRGYGPARRVLLGSVSSRLLEVSHCPVVVVPRGTRTFSSTVPAVAVA